MVALDGSGQIRRLTDVSDLGGHANQSVPAPDGRRIAFVIDAPPSGPYAGKGGLYVGAFLTDRCAKEGQRPVHQRHAGREGSATQPERAEESTVLPERAGSIDWVR